MTNKPKDDITFLGHWSNWTSENGQAPVFYGSTWQNAFLSGGENPLNVAGWQDAPRFFPNDNLLKKNGFKSGSFVDPQRLQIVTDQAHPNGKPVLRVEVRSGDHRTVHSGERAELAEMVDKHGVLQFATESSGRNGVEFIGISVKVPTDWVKPTFDTQYPPPSPQYHWGSVLQLHSPNYLNSPPAFSFEVMDEFQLGYLGGDLHNGSGGRRDVVTYPFSNGALNRGEWVEFLIEVKWRFDSTGYIKINRRNQNENEFTEVLSILGPTLQYYKQIRNVEVLQDLWSPNATERTYSITINGTVISFNSTSTSPSTLRNLLITGINNANVGCVAEYVSNAIQLRFNSKDYTVTDLVNVNFNGVSNLLDYWRTGFYRSTSPHTNIIYLGSIVKGNNRNAVIKEAFGR